MDHVKEKQKGRDRILGASRRSGYGFNTEGFCARFVQRGNKPKYLKLWWRCRDLNPGHCGYEADKGDSESPDLVKETEDNQEVTKRK